MAGQTGTGTKQQYRDWLTAKGMTYTRYTTLDPQKKAEIWREYRTRGKK